MAAAGSSSRRPVKACWYDPALPEALMRDATPGSNPFPNGDLVMKRNQDPESGGRGASWMVISR